MISFSKYHKICIVLLFIVIVMIMPVSASLQISGTVKYMEDLTPGATVTFPIILSLSNTDVAGDYNITVFGFGNDKNGNYVTINPESDVSEHTARPYITLDKSVVYMTPGAQEKVTATVTVPVSATGGLYALINIHKSQGTGMVRTAINVPVMLTIKGTELVETGTIKSITVKGDNVATVFTNTGNHHYYGVKNTITLSDTTGKTVFESTTKPEATAIVPGESITFIQPVDMTVPAGDYQVYSMVSTSNPTALATDSSQITLISSGAAVLQTEITEQPTSTPKSPTGIEVGIVSIIGAIVCMGIYRKK